MTKKLARWFRKIHRWIAVPTALLIPVVAIFRLMGSPATVAAWEKLDKIPSLLMLFMAITGAYLFLLPYIIRARKKKNGTQQGGVDYKTDLP